MDEIEENMMNVDYLPVSNESHLLGCNYSGSELVRAQDDISLVIVVTNFF